MSNKIKIIVALIAITTVIALSLGSVGIAYSVLHKEKIKLGTQFLYGDIEENSWSNTDQFDITNYPSITVSGETSKILFVTDPHVGMRGKYADNFWTANISNQKAYEHIDKLIKETNPDVIVCTGDVQADPLNDLVYKDFFGFIDGYDIPWTTVFGNHDSEWRADKAYLANILTSYKNSLFRVGPTNLQGLGNSIINFEDSKGNIFYSLIQMDSGDWQQIAEKKVNYENVFLDKSERRFSTISVGITEAQAEWYKWVVEGLKKNNNDIVVETAIAQHIPLKGQYYALKLTDQYVDNIVPNSLMNARTSDDFVSYSDLCDYYVMPESIKNATLEAKYADYKANYKIYNYISSLGSTKSMFTGHNHDAGYAAIFDGITFTSVAKTTDIYTDYAWDNGNRGGTLVKIGVVAKNGSHVLSNKAHYVK